MDGQPDTSDIHETSRRDTTFKRVLKIVVPLVVTVMLTTWLLHKVNLPELRAALHEHVSYAFIAGMMALTVLSHVIRGIRWGYQLRAAGIQRIPVLAESSSIFGAYALNLVFPYLGEAWRCVYISRTYNAKLSTVIGTDIGDRASDLVVIVLLCGLTLIVAHPQMVSFIHSITPHPSVSHTLGDAPTAVIVVIAVALMAYWLLERKKGVRLKLMQSLRRIYAGFAVLFHMKGTGAYILLTLGIWCCYFLQTYLCLFAFPFTRGLVTAPHSLLGIIPALVVFVFGSCSMAVPSNGGLGPWNIAVVFGLTLYGIDSADATAWSLVYWGWQTVAQIAAGIFAAIYIARQHGNRLRRLLSRPA